MSGGGEVEEDEDEADEMEEEPEGCRPTIESLFLVCGEMAPPEEVNEIGLLFRFLTEFRRWCGVGGCCCFGGGVETGRRRGIFVPENDALLEVLAELVEIVEWWRRFFGWMIC